MQTVDKPVPVGTKVYSTLARCCRHQNVRPGSGVQPVFDSLMNPRGFAVLPAHPVGESGVFILWRI